MKTKEHKLIQSYVADKYFISTVYRCASIPEYEMWFYETIIWEWNKETKQRGHIALTEDSGAIAELALNRHAELCKEYWLKRKEWTD